MKFTANLLVTSPPGRFSGDVRSRRLLLDGGLNYPPSSAQGPRKGPLFSATRLGGRRRIWANYLGDVDRFGFMFLQIYDRNDYDRISLFNRSAGGFRCFFATERTLELSVHL